jgi:glyoxylase-like metal-dependent hydrolase (beta-lactamase superfamily II)
MEQMSMKIAALQFNPICENTYVVWDATNECVVIDAGNANEQENRRLQEFIDSRGLRPVMAINTHGHFDHTMGVQFLKDTYQIPFALSEKDRFLLESATPGSSIFGVKVTSMPSSIEVNLEANPEIHFGETVLQVLPTPGHTPGHVAFYCAAQKVLFTGDTLFRESIGRTDLPGGDYSWIMRSILDTIIPLGDEVQLYPGHGEATSIGHEVLYNPFIVEVLNEEVHYK